MTMERKVQVAVPKHGKRQHWNMGVFVPDFGVIHVDIPLGVAFGDEFEVTYRAPKEPKAARALRVPLPYGLKPGMTFRHRTPNGKEVLVSCPPGVNENTMLLVPWGDDSANPHYIIQAYIEPDSDDQTKQQQSGAYANQARNKRNNTPMKPGGFRRDDLELAMALSLTTLGQTPASQNEDELLEMAIKKSLIENVPKHLLEQNMPTTQKSSGVISANVARTITTNNEDDEERILLELAMKQSLEEAQKKASLQQQYQPNHSSETSTYTSAPRSEYELSEKEMERLIIEHSIREAEERASRLNGTTHYEPQKMTLDQSGYTNKKQAGPSAPVIANQTLL